MRTSCMRRSSANGWLTRTSHCGENFSVALQTRIARPSTARTSSTHKSKKLSAFCRSRRLPLRRLILLRPSDCFLWRSFLSADVTAREKDARVGSRPAVLPSMPLRVFQLSRLAQCLLGPNGGFPFPRERPSPFHSPAHRRSMRDECRQSRLRILELTIALRSVALSCRSKHTMVRTLCWAFCQGRTVGLTQRIDHRLASDSFDQMVFHENAALKQCQHVPSGVRDRQ